MGPDDGRPAATWPSHASLIYARDMITVALLALALPWLTYKLITDPGSVLSGLGARAAQVVT